MRSKKLFALVGTATGVLILDQLSKWLVRTTPELQNMTIIEGWLEFYYTQNPGMALGIEILSTPVISSIAIVATLGILIYVLMGLKEATMGYVICMGLIVGGAIGNILDRIFMGIVEGYGGILDGHVVDFIYFSLQIDGWTVFPYIFNVADVAISVAIISLLLFGKKIFIDHSEFIEEEFELREAEAENENGDSQPATEEVPEKGSKEDNPFNI